MLDVFPLRTVFKLDKSRLSILFYPLALLSIKHRGPIYIWKWAIIFGEIFQFVGALIRSEPAISRGFFVKPRTSRYFGKCMRVSLKIWSISSLIILANAANAHELRTKLGLEIERTDNAALVSDDLKAKDLKSAPSLAIDYQLTFATVDASLRYAANTEKYHDETFDNRTEILGSGDVKWTILPQKLFWNFFQNRNRLQINPQDSRSPDNETVRDVLRLGPTLQFNLSGNSTLQLDTNFVRNSFELETLLDSRINQYAIDFDQSLGAQLNWGVDFSYKAVSFDDPRLNYDNQRGGVNFSGSGRKYNYEITIGRNVINRDLGESVSGLYFSAVGSLVSSANSTWQFWANKELTDSSIGLGLNQNVSDSYNNGDTNFSDNDIVKRSRYEISYTRSLLDRLVKANLSVFYDQQDFQILTKDATTLGGRLTLRYQWSPRLNLVYWFNWQDEDFELPARGADSSITRMNRAEARYALTRKANVAFWISDNTRSSLVGLLNEYEKFTTGITFTYEF